MKRRSRVEYVVDKLVHHLGKSHPRCKAEILRQVLLELHGPAAPGGEASVQPHWPRGGAQLPEAGQRRMGRRRTDTP